MGFLMYCSQTIHAMYNIIKRRRTLSIIACVVCCGLFLLYMNIELKWSRSETLADEWIRKPRDGMTDDRLLELEAHLIPELHDRQESMSSIIYGDRIYPKNFRYRINNATDMCIRANYSLLVYVHSALTNFQRRDVLRATWANRDLLNELKVGLLFVIGSMTHDVNSTRKLIEESEKYVDIVQTEYNDTYQNISVKAATALTWAATNCAPYVPFILKADDDMFIDIALLMTYIREYIPNMKFNHSNDRLIFCYVRQHCSVIRDPRNKWYISEDYYTKQYYPPYCPGAAFLMTSQALRALHVSLNGSRIYPLDDVWITAMLTQNTGIELIPINNIYSLYNKKHLTILDMFSRYIFSHSSVENIRQLWQFRGYSIWKTQ